jgi:hypothetical protein
MRVLRSAFPLAALALVTVGVGCGPVITLPPVPAPSREMPPVQLTSTPPPQGRQYVVFDVPGQHVQVADTHDVALYRGTGSESVNLCVTPCVADMRIGDHQVAIGGDTVPITVTKDPLVVRHVSGSFKDTGNPSAETASIWCGLFGFLSAATGAVLAPVGFLNHNDTLGAVGLSAVGVGAVLMVLTYVLNSSPQYITPGNTTQWTLPPSSPPQALLRF